MLCLGISGGFNFAHENVYRFGYGLSHDGGAALVEDGTVVAAIEEERLNRIKHSNKFPELALQYCLARRGVSVDAVDRFAFYLEEHSCNSVLSGSLRYQEDEQANKRLDARSILCDRLQRTFERAIDPERITFVPHHLAHAVSAFALSGFERCLVLAVDGIGDFLSGIVAVGDGGRLHEIKRLQMKQSLGSFYFSVTRLLGFTFFDEYKVMGLAPYGDPSRYRADLRGLYDLLPDGDYDLRLDDVALLAGRVKPRRHGEPITQEHKDLAAALQEVLEQIVLHVLTHYSRTTRHHQLCLAGGVAQNCTMNGKILYSGLFEQVFVQPASHDAGCALGAALATGAHESQTRPQLRHVFWGPDIGDAMDVARALEKWTGLVRFARIPDIASKTAELLADGAVVAWVQGRSEFGPRALGNRSILADPRPAENKDRINKIVKKREAFRPFAPSVLEEYVDEYFDVPLGRGSLSFMSFVVRVREDKRQLLGAVTHVDGSARLQAVSKEANPRFWTLLTRFKELTGIPCLLNTSFNNNVEPIVDSVEDGIVTYLTTDLDYLVVGDYLVTKQRVGWEVLANLYVSLPPHVRMQQDRGVNRSGEVVSDYALTNTSDSRFRLSIDETLYRLLTSVDEHSPLGEHLKHVCGSDAERRATVRALLDLWRQRQIKVHPSPVAVPAVSETAPV